MSALPAPTFKFGDNDNHFSASQRIEPKSADLQFERPDWTMFRSVSTLAQKAGVPTHLLRRLVIKELVDNALDAGASASVRVEDGVYIVDDDGPGIEGEPADIARLFSIDRPMVSTKLLRLPTRGALGNGLRVVSGAVAASGGTLTVTTRNRRHRLSPLDNGSTANDWSDAPRPVGTRIEVSLGPDMPHDDDPTAWADMAIVMAGGESYAGKSSPFWYDGDHFYELLQAAGDRPVRDLIANLDGCTGAKAGLIASDFKGRPCRSLDRDQAIALLGAARSHARDVNPKRLGFVGKRDALPQHYAVKTGTASIGGRSPKADIPFTIEAWAEMTASPEDTSVEILVNRTPITGEVTSFVRKGRIAIHGAGLGHWFDAKPGGYRIVLNVTTPHCPITTDGKEPDLRLFLTSIHDAVTSIARKAKASGPRVRASRTQKDIVEGRLAEAIAKASGGGEYRFSSRQLFYVVRPFIMDELEADLTWGNFCAILTTYESDHGDIAGMYRDPRGTLYHPHMRQDIALGTLAVEKYERPAWTFNKVLFIEKEGFFEALKAAKWPERNDCALLTSKGYSTRAVRDLLDSFAVGEEPITIFAAHDADAFGSMIMQTLQEATKARARRKIEIVNLGLDPWDAISMGLDIEDRDKNAKPAAVADYIKERSDGAYWTPWLQKHRVELNAMTTPEFIAWLDGKMVEHPTGRVSPPVGVMRERLIQDVESELRRKITDRILREADIDGLVADALSDVPMPSDDQIAAAVKGYQAGAPDALWSAWISVTAPSMAA
ncbi:ATP-binding protein [Aurantimonas sp. E1-2-R+4]|uniref:ATP-binding protein n=1 Tax=Aurantimonas sp. E1-2-R+4 TaxID=3113714 RepID=UPI002F95E70B